MRDDEPRPVWMSLPITHGAYLVFITAVPNTKLCPWCVCLLPLLQDLVQSFCYGGKRKKVESLKKDLATTTSVAKAAVTRVFLYASRAAAHVSLTRR